MPIDTLEAIRARRSVKEFSDEVVDKATIGALLELAVLAPNHRMTEPWGFIVLGPEARRAYGEIKGSQRARPVEDPEVALSVKQATVDSMASLPAMIAFTQRLDEDPAVREEDFATVYMGIQNFLLGAEALGLGTHVKTGSTLNEAVTHEALGVAEGERVIALVHLGRAAKVPEPKPRTASANRTRWLP